jgi:hypothetical protein
LIGNFDFGNNKAKLVEQRRIKRRIRVQLPAIVYAQCLAKVIGVRVQINPVSERRAMVIGDVSDRKEIQLVSGAGSHGYVT